MISGKDITASVSCLFENEDPIWMLQTSARKLGVSVKPYGLGLTYQGWIHIKVELLRQEALNCPTSHILYTDARDAWFLAGPDEIAQKYNTLGCPPLMLSAQCDIFGTYAKWYEGIPWDMSKRFRYIGTPGQLCEAKALANALGWMQEHYHLGEPSDPQGLPDDDPPWWIEYMRAHPGAVALDTECAIFMNAGSELQPEGMWNVLEIEDMITPLPMRVYNKLTGTRPCVLHFNGGYSHAAYGKWEQLEKFWTALGNTERPPWEAK